MNTKKIRAFTLSELLVVLVISSIVIALSFVVLGLVQKQISLIRNGSQKEQEILLLKRVLLKDIQTHNAFFDIKEQNLFCYSDIDTVQYVFESDYILRERDTIKLKVIGAQFLLDHRIVESGWIDAMYLSFDQTFGSKKIFLYKLKDAAHYLNH
ncbi:PulJ/GspJ family protein [Winogradskyella sp.]|uniref:PulJ/GspJ family protein n=1 Tax=Winogradskyella sp. TaxID=1883156 RepID=UPI003AB1988B